MLRYLAKGRRWFGLRPMYRHRRADWEFFAVLQGRCGPTLADGKKPTLCTRHLWVFPPETAHGWCGQRARSCRVAVFHFSTVPDLLEKAARPIGYVSRPLTAAQARRVARLADELQPHYQRMTGKSALVFERALLDLSLLALESISPEHLDRSLDRSARKVEAVITWYGEHMAEQPKLEQAAQAVNVSARHLRRLFRDVRGESPQTVFTRLRMQRAMELLSQSDCKLDAIVAACGFSSSSDLCRVFKRYRHISPGAWRRQIVNEYRPRAVQRAARLDAKGRQPHLRSAAASRATRWRKRP